MNQKSTSSYKLALPEEILLQVEKPERYLGNELNVVRKDKSTIDIRFCMAFPDVYEIGMSHLGIQILYAMFNRRTDTWCERVYSPWADLDHIMRQKKIPLFALEGYLVRAGLFSMGRPGSHHAPEKDSALCAGITGSREGVRFSRHYAAV